MNQDFYDDVIENADSLELTLMAIVSRPLAVAPLQVRLSQSFFKLLALLRIHTSSSAGVAHSIALGFKVKEACLLGQASDVKPRSGLPLVEGSTTLRLPPAVLHMTPSSIGRHPHGLGGALDSHGVGAAWQRLGSSLVSSDELGQSARHVVMLMDCAQQSVHDYPSLSLPMRLMMQEAFKGRLGLTLDLMGKVMEMEGSIPKRSAQSSQGFALAEDREDLDDLMERFDPGDLHPIPHVDMLLSWPCAGIEVHHPDASPGSGLFHRLAAWPVIRKH